LGGLSAGTYASAQVQESHPAANSDSRRVDETNDHLDRIDKQASHLEQEVLMMLGLGGLIIAVLFGSIIFGEYRIKKAVSETEDQLREVRQRFPKLAEIETELGDVTIELESEFESSEWTDDRYTKLAIESRQHILTIEHLIPFGLEGSATPALFRGFANFYFSKFAVERVAADLDRALYYALRAKRRGNGGFQYLNDLGLIYMEFANRDAAYWSDAEACLLESKRRNRQQQRCFYNLGLIYFDLGVYQLSHSDRDKGRNLLIQARDQWMSGLKNTDWEMTPIPGLTSLIHYNLACVLCRLAEIDHATPQKLHIALDEVIEHLNQAAGYRKTKLSTLEHDLTAANGDLAALGASPQHQHEIGKIRSRLERVWSAES
jgi:hypothetical protein